MENNNFKFEQLKNKLKLSIDERAFHRTKILKYMSNEMVAEIKTIPIKIVSPYQSKLKFFIKKHLVPTVIALLFFLGTGIAVNAEQSLPNDYLYGMRIKLIEPTKILLASNTQKKTNLRIAFADRALRDYSKVSQKKEIKPSDKATLIKSISENVKGANEGILQLAKETNTPNSLKIANDLQSILQAHSLVLSKIQTLKSELGGPSEISAQVTDSLKSTKEIVTGLTETIQNDVDQTKLDQTISDQKKEINTSLQDIDNINKKDESNEVVLEVNEKKATIEDKLSTINQSIMEADQKLESGYKKEAFSLYNEIYQKLGELKSILESEKNLVDVDVLSKAPSDLIPIEITPKTNEETKDKEPSVKPTIKIDVKSENKEMTNPEINKDNNSDHSSIIPKS